MNAKRTLAAGTFAVLLGVVVHISLANGADAVPPPEDAAATQQLNNTIANCNKSEDDRFQAQQGQFQQERQKNQDILTQYQTQNDTMHKQYDDLRANYALLELQNDEERKQNQDLQQKYQDMQQKLQEAQLKYDDVLKASQPMQPMPEAKSDEDAFHRLLGIIRQGP